MTGPTPEQVLDLLGIEHFPRTNRLAFRCPIHDDNDPSAGFYLDTDLAHCFSCEYTLDPVGFYAKVEGMKREDAVRELSKRFGPIGERVQRCDKMLLDTERMKAESVLKQEKDLGQKLHAAAGETVDRITMAYERGQLTDVKFLSALQVWYKRVRENPDGFVNRRITENGADAGVEESPGNLSGPGRQGDGSHVEDSSTDGSVDLD